MLKLERDATLHLTPRGSVLNNIVDEVENAQVGVLHWEPVAKGDVQHCTCDREGCITVLTVLNTEENVIEIYHGNMNSLQSCIARIELPENLALCRAVSITNADAHPTCDNDLRLYPR